jgi:hypothetical protein
LSDEFFTLKPTVGGQELTMARYSLERREAVLKKLLPPHNRSVPEVSREEGILAGARRACAAAALRAHYSAGWKMIRFSLTVVLRPCDPSRTTP